MSKTGMLRVFRSASVCVLAAAHSGVAGAALPQRASETSMVVVRESTGVVGAFDRVVIENNGHVTGALCVPGTTQLGGEVVAMRLDGGELLKLQQAIAAASVVSREARVNPVRAFTFSVTTAATQLRWEQGASAPALQLLETSVLDLLTRLGRMAGAGWKCSLY